MLPPKTFHVFIDRTQPGTPEEIPRVAKGIAARFGVPAAMIEQRLRAGRFRVKGNVERDKAIRFKAELEALGAVCSIVSVDEPAAAVRTPVTRLPTPPPMPIGQAAPVTGLAAATVDSAGDSGSLGALDDGAALSSGGIRLATLDGEEDEEPEPEPAAFDPSERDLSPEPAPEPKPDPEPPAPSGNIGAGHDPFMPPEMAQEKQDLLELDTALPERAPAARGADSGDSSAPSPPAARGTLAPEPFAGASPAARGKAGDSLIVTWRRKVANDDRTRLLVGVLLAIVVGFIPATILSSVRERPAFAKIKADLLETYASATTPAQSEGLDEVRDASLDLMSSRRFNIAVTSCLLWAIVGAGFAYFWFRRFDWRRYASGAPPPPSSAGGTSST